MTGNSADHAAHLARRTALAEGVHAIAVRPVLHGDNGATLKGTTVLAILYWLGIGTRRISRPWRYFHGMVTKAKVGTLNLDRTLWAHAAGRRAETAQPAGNRRWWPSFV